MRIEFRTMTFIGPDSEKAARAAAAAGEQNREAYFTQLWYFNQGQENSGLRDRRVHREDLDGRRRGRREGQDVRRQRRVARARSSSPRRSAEKYGVVSTPTFLIGETGKPLTKFDVNLDDADAFAAAFDELLK